MSTTVTRRRMKRGPGRPSRLTPGVKERIMNTVRCGGSFKMAAQAAGIGETTFHDWKRWGEDPKGKPEYKQFLAELQQAEAEGNAARVAIVMKAARTDWKAASWLLERRLPELFSIRYQLEVGAAGTFNLFDQMPEVPEAYLNAKPIEAIEVDVPDPDGT